MVAPEKTKVDICGGCDQPCRAVVYVGGERIPLCFDCHEFIAETDIEWDRDITRKQLKAKIIMLKSIKKHDKILRGLAHGKKKKKKKISKRGSKA